MLAIVGQSRGYVHEYCSDPCDGWLAADAWHIDRDRLTHHRVAEYRADECEA